MNLELAMIRIVCIALFFTIIPGRLSAELNIDYVAPSESENQSSGGDVNTEENLNPFSDMIQFKNKDQLHGKMLSVDQKGILWSSEETMENITFKKDHIQNILLGNSKLYSNSANAEVLLTNGDRLAGKLIKLDDSELLLSTEYAGELHIDRSMVTGIYPGTSDGAQSYKGPNEIEEWMVINNSGDRNSKVNIQNGVMTLSGYYICAGRDMKLTDLSKIEFDMEAFGNCQMQVQIYGDRVKRNPRGSYVLYISSGYIYLQRFEDGTSSNMGSFRSQSIKGGKAKITILANRKDKRITLMINGELAKEWTDTEWAGKGGFVSFINQSNNAVNIKNIVVSQWNGKVPGQQSGSSDGDTDSIAFLNDDVVSGHLKSITDGNVVFKTEYADMNIPLERVKEILTAVDSQHRARRRAEDIRCYFQNGNAVTLELQTIKSGVIEGKSENFGVASMKLNAFSRLQFNLYDEDDGE